MVLMVINTARNGVTTPKNGGVALLIIHCTITHATVVAATAAMVLVLLVLVKWRVWCEWLTKTVNNPHVETLTLAPLSVDTTCGIAPKWVF